MSIDSVALLHISALQARKAVPKGKTVIALGPDACGVSLAKKHVALELDPDEAAERLLSEVGGALRLHTDRRGVLLYPSAVEPKRGTYAALVSELEDEGFWIDRDMLDQSTRDLEDDEDDEDNDGAFIERLGGVYERDGKGRDAPIVSVSLHNTTPSAEDLERLIELTALRDLNLRRVLTLTRGTLVQLAKLKNLERLVLDELRISDEEVEILSDIPRLTSLSLIKTRVQGDGFLGFTEHAALKEIIIGYTPLDDDGLHSIVKLPHLESLKLEPSNVKDAGVSAVAKHAKLRVLNASRTRITDAVLPALIAAPSLESVSLRGTALTASALARLRKRKNLQVIADA